MDQIDIEKQKINGYLEKYYDEFLIRESESALKTLMNFGKIFLLSGGRRLLPISVIKTFLGLASERDLNQYSEEIYNVSLSVEMLHISSLIIEEIVDKEEHRGQNKSCHYMMKSYFQEASQVEKSTIQNVTTASTIYEGNIISLLGQKMINESQFGKKQKRKALKIYQEGAINITKGRLLNEYYKIQNIRNIKLEDYLILAGLKRGSQRATAAGLGAIFGNSRDSQMEPLMKAMNKIGIIEQLINDREGFESDIRSGQATLLPIIAYQNANEEQINTLNNILGKPNITNDQIAQVKEIYEDTNAMNFINFYAFSLKNDAYQNLNDVYPGLREETVDFFEKMISFIIG